MHEKNPGKCQGKLIKTAMKQTKNLLQHYIQNRSNYKYCNRYVSTN